MAPPSTPSLFLSSGARTIGISGSSVNNAVLQRYAMFRTGKLGDVPDEKASLAERAPVDSEHDTRLKIGGDWMGGGELSDASTGNQVGTS